MATSLADVQASHTPSKRPSLSVRAIHVRADFPEVLKATRLDQLYRGNFAECAIRAIHPLVGKRRVAKQLVQAYIYGQQVRDALGNISIERRIRLVSLIDVAIPSVNRAIAFMKYR